MFVGNRFQVYHFHLRIIRGRDNTAVYFREIEFTEFYKTSIKRLQF